jgi:hypothetical protein
MSRSLAVAAAALPLLLLPTDAPADDSSLREAGRSHDAEFTRLGKATRHAFLAFADSGYRLSPARG